MQPIGEQLNLHIIYSGLTGVREMLLPEGFYLGLSPLIDALDGAPNHLNARSAIISHLLEYFDEVHHQAE